MEESDIKKLESELADFTGNVEILFHEKEGDAFSKDLEEFLRTLSGMTGDRISSGKGNGDFALPGIPAFTLGSGGNRNIHYLALPEKNEIAPFVKALKYTAEGHAPIDAETEANLSKVSSPAEIQVFVSPFCTNCPKVVETVVAFASKSSHLSAIIVDVQRYNELAEPYGIKSVPATVIDKELVLIAQVSPERLSALLAERGSEFYDRELIRSFMERSRPAEAAELICEGRGRKGILEMFQEPEFSTRMGVLVVLEHALEKNADALREMVPALIDLLSHEDSRIRGDIADFLGTVGDPRAIPHLEKLLKDSDPDVAEAAEDALDELRD
jgi:alkyl hydroperoxide reductase subunit AhpF